MTVRKLELRHIHAVNRLIEKYESLTEKDFNVPIYSSYLEDTLCQLTGFGAPNNCMLCVSTKIDTGYGFRNSCEKCIYNFDRCIDNVETSCCQYENRETFNAISNANTVAEILIAVKNRANHLRDLLADYYQLQRIESENK